MYKKLKSYLGNDAIFMAGLLLFVGIASFGLGRLSVSETLVRQPQVSSVALISSALPPLSTTTSTTTTTPVTSARALLSAREQVVGSYVGSKSGTKYHLVTCAGAKRIKEENKIYFKTTVEAEAAGYSKAANCPGL